MGKIAQLSKRWLFVGSTLLILLILLVLPLNHYLQNYWSVPRSPLHAVPSLENALKQALLAVPDYYFGGYSAGSRAPRLDLNIQKKHFDFLSQKRDEALKIGALYRSEDDFVPALVILAGKSVRAKVRLKGDMLDHLQGRRWSFRVHVKDGEGVLGMRRFSLQAPYTRGFQAEPLLFAFMRAQGILAPRSAYVELYVNGRRIGVTNIEESFAKELLEFQKRKDGVILKFDEDRFWRTKALGLAEMVEIETYGWRTGELESFQTGRLEASPILSIQLRRAESLVRAMMEDTLKPSDVFDVDLMGRWLAGCEIFHAQHMTFWHNLRWYLNPLSARLEPIAFDSNVYFYTPFGGKLGCMGDQQNFTKTLVEDSLIAAAFIKHLKRLTTYVLSDDFTAFMSKYEAEYLQHLRADYPWMPMVSVDLLRFRAKQLADLNAENLREQLANPLVLPATIKKDPKKRQPAILHAFVANTDDGYGLEFVNLGDRDVVIDKLQFNALRLEAEMPLVELMGIELPLRLSASQMQNLPNRQRWILPVEADLEPGQLVFSGEGYIEGEEHRYRFESTTRVDSAMQPWLAVPDLQQTLKSHPYIAVSKTEPMLLQLAPGQWQIKEWIILPEGYKLAIAAGTQLNFATDVGLISWGGFDFSGSVAEPIRFQGIDGASWPGIVSLHSEVAHQFSNVVFDGTSGMRYGDWALSGGVTLRLSKAVLTDVRFSHNTAEHALNLVRSHVDLVDVSVEDSRWNALVCDFCRGQISGGSFSRIGADAIDMRGSKLTLSDIDFVNVKDTAVSIAEASHLSAQGLSVAQVGTGFISKDNSSGFIEASKLQDIAYVAVMVYSNKKVFGGAALTVENITMERVAVAHVVQHGSRLNVNGESIATQVLNIETLYEADETRANGAQ